MLLQYTKKSSSKLPDTPASKTITQTPLEESFPTLAERLNKPLPIDKHVAAIYHDREREAYREYRSLLLRISGGSSLLAETENGIWCKFFLTERKRSLRTVDSLEAFNAYLRRMISNLRKDERTRRPTFLEIHESDWVEAGKEIETKEVFEQLPEWIDQRYSKAPQVAHAFRQITALRLEAPETRQAELARRLRVTQTTVSRMLTRFQKDIPDYLTPER